MVILGLGSFDSQSAGCKEKYQGYLLLDPHLERQYDWEWQNEKGSIH